MYLKQIQLLPSVVARLRLVFLSVSLVLLTAMVLGFLQIRGLTKTADLLSLGSVPVFVRAQEIESSLTDLILLLRAVDNVNRVEELDPLRASLAEKTEVLKRDIDVLMQRKSQSEIVANMSKALERIDGRVDRLLALKRDIILFEMATAQVEEFLKESQFSARDALEELSYNTAVLIDRDVTANGITAENFEQIYSRNLKQANAVTELTLEIEAIITTASRLSQISDPIDVTQIEKEIRFKSQSVSTLIGQLRPGPARQALAEEVLAIRRLVFGDMGILEQVSLTRDLRLDFSALNANENVSIQVISAAATDLVADTRLQVEQSRQSLITASNKVVAFLLFSGVASMLVFGIANLFIVEKQINQRMSRLTKAVSAIAANETDYKVDVDGSDELGEMALALETFKATAEELRRSNTELEKFAYVAAHDLRSPLRAIQDLAEWTLEDEENRLSDQGKENMAMLQSRVNRLNQILSDLLTYSRVGKQGDDLNLLSLSQLVRSTGDMLDPNDHFNIVYSGTSNDVVTYVTPLRQILLNLVNNSIKHHDLGAGEIQVTAHIDNGRIKVSVEDDGPGIEPQDHERIFGLFQTLRPRDEVEGSGLGLAIIKKQVEHYGGTIRVKSNPKLGRGTKFEFDMPVKASQFQSNILAA